MFGTGDPPPGRRSAPGEVLGERASRCALNGNKNAVVRVFDDEGDRGD
jgi:hypothetical protein